jgi:hypothetical protein
MNMPGFTAEVSLNSSKVQYHTRGGGRLDAARGVGVVPSATRQDCENLSRCCLAGFGICCWGHDRFC